jgi:putative spermidine/putrescine transport system permease protein
MILPAKFTVILLLAPALLVIGLLFAGGLVIAFAQSLGYFAPIGDGGFTLAHYLQLWFDREFRMSLAVTLMIATAATIISAAAGLAIALALRGLVGRHRTLNFWLQAPLAVPHLVMAVALINIIAPSGLIARVFYAAGLIDGPADFPSLINDRYGAGIIMAYVFKETPFVATMTLALLLRLGDEYEALAGTLGASVWQRLRFVTLPLVAPAAVSASLVVFAFVFGAFEVPYLLGRPYPAMLSVVSQRRYLDINLAERPGAIAVAIVISAITAFFVWLYLRLARRLTGTEKPLIF